MLRKRTTGPGVSGATGRPERPVKEKVWPEWRITPTRLSRAVLELARERPRLAETAGCCGSRGTDTEAGRDADFERC